uniref:Small G protein signaling modulator 2 n=1 Tax=Pseudonaja textilis TaxID=8673 RepID=A0A670Z0Y5_PSETE
DKPYPAENPISIPMNYLLHSFHFQVKQIMEEAVTRKFVHEDSSHIIALCGMVEICLLHMLKRRASGFLRTDKIAALFTKVGKTYDVASEICRKVQELLQQVEGRQASTTNKPSSLSPQAIKHIWVRTALIERVLDKIVQYLVDNNSKYYEREALLADPVFGPILACLLVGPCALDYTKLKTADHFWTDPSADELVQRHRIHGTHSRQDSPSKRPALGIRKRHSSGSTSEDRFAASARDYVESLHQNSRTHLLYGKNNVLVQPKDDMEAIPGYLSLHQSSDSLTLKWTPNQLMNGNLGDSELEKSIYWDYALIVPFSQIVCIHCHQQPDQGGTLVLVSQDGIQRPPLHFPPGGHLLAFLSCLENGLLPRGQLEPPLWSQQGKGKVFPKLRKRNSYNRSMDMEEMPSVMETATDYVFRIIYPGYGAGFFSWQLDHYSQGSLCLSCSTAGSPHLPSCCTCIHDSLNNECQTCSMCMLSFPCTGLAHCRHLSTVRTHLSALVNHSIIPPDKPTSAAEGLTKEVWSKYQKDKKNYKELELLRLVYYGGVQHDIRKEVWPFLLGHYKFGMNKKEMELVDRDIVRRYQKVMSEWKACEVVVKLREKESQTTTKFSSGSSIDSHVQRLIHRDSTISNDVRQSGGNNGLFMTCGLQFPAWLVREFWELKSDTTGKYPPLFSNRFITRLCIFQIEMLDTVALNLHRIDKDVQRCDRNYWYFTAENLEKLRNIMCSYVWEHLEVGYVQGMCDLLAPLLVILDKDELAYSCFTHLMKRMSQNFPNGGAMDTHFANMRSLIQILDSELFELMHQNGDYTHFYFCYRWFLLDFKRELLYEDVFTVWEVIWAAKHISSEHFVLFIALALVESYREIIRDNNMDFTDIIKFFNEMAEHHNAQEILKIARDLVCKVQTLIENK